MGSEVSVHPVKAARKARGERQCDLADAAGISVSYVSMIEHGLVPGEDLQGRIATALERPAGELWPA